MAFWKDNGAEPKRQFRFKIDGDGNWFWAKSIDKPTVEVASNSYQLINHKFNFPGIATWQPVSILVVDDSFRTGELYDALKQAGYNNPGFGGAAAPVVDGIKIHGYNGKDIIFNQLNANGVPLETWTLHNSIITNIDFGKLEYDSDDLVELRIQITYDFATLEELNRRDVLVNQTAVPE
jgi:hypothetical protein